MAGAAKALQQLGDRGKYAYRSLVGSLTVLRLWAEGLGLALKYKPDVEDYSRVKELLALYVAEKLLRWPKSNTWYDNECMYVMG